MAAQAQWAVDAGQVEDARRLLVALDAKAPTGVDAAAALIAAAGLRQHDHDQEGCRVLLEQAREVLAKAVPDQAYETWRTLLLRQRIAAASGQNDEARLGPEFLALRAADGLTLRQQADAAALVAATAAASAEAAAAAAQKAVDDLIQGMVRREAAAATQARSRADTLKGTADTARTAAQNAKTAYEEAVRNSGSNSTQARAAKRAYDLASSAYAAASAAASAADGVATRAEKALATATQRAKASAPVVAAQVKADAAKAAVAPAVDAAAVAKKAADAAAEVQLAAEKTADDLEEMAAQAKEIEDAWLVYRAGTLKIENGHAAILHTHVETLTDKLAKLEAIGWSPDEMRARKLSFDFWPSCRESLIIQIREAEAAAQVQFDADSNHGAN